MAEMMHNTVPAIRGVHRIKSLLCNTRENPAVKVIMAMMKVSDMVIRLGCHVDERCDGCGNAYNACNAYCDCVFWRVWVAQ
jgi:hypothetical protein